MALVTRCPNCATTFRVTPVHLQVHGGDVRCGRCAHIFSGFATLATMQEPETVDLPGTKVGDTSESTPEAPPAAVHDAPAPISDSDRKASAPAPDQEIIPPERLGEAVTREATHSEPPAEEEPKPQAPDTASASQNYAAESHTAEDPAMEGYAAEGNTGEDYTGESYAFDTPATRKTSPGWAFFSLFLLVVLAAQAVYFYRAELSVIAPDARPYLEQYCELLQCTIPLPQNAVLMSIESSEMLADMQYPGAVMLMATVRNHARYPQAFPSFELAFTDSQDQPLASHIFTPDAYLEANMDPAGAIAPHHEFNVKLRLDSGDLNAAGYRLLLFYPGS